MNPQEFKNVPGPESRDTVSKYQPRVNPYHKQIRGMDIYDNSYLKNPLAPEPEPEPAKKKTKPSLI